MLFLNTKCFHETPVEPFQHPFPVTFFHSNFLNFLINFCFSEFTFNFLNNFFQTYFFVSNSI